MLLFSIFVSFPKHVHINIHLWTECLPPAKRNTKDSTFPSHSGRHYPHLFCNHLRYFAFYCIMPYCASRNNIEMLISATICLYLCSTFHLAASACGIQRIAITNRSRDRTNSDEAGSPSHRSTTYPSATLRKDNSVSLLQNLLTLTHSLLDNRSEQPFVVSLCVSQTDEETGWEKSFACGHTHVSGESLHCQAFKEQTEGDGRGAAGRSCRWLFVTSNERCGRMNMWCAEEELF